MKTHALRQKALTMARALTTAEGLTTASARLEQHTEHSPPERGARQKQERSPRTHACMQRKREAKSIVCSLERGGMAMPLFRPAVPSLHPALTFRCSVTSLARCTNF
jgi:hypothetical protein